MTADEARLELRMWAADLEVLRPFVGTVLEGERYSASATNDGMLVTKAWNLAARKFQEALVKYVSYCA